MRLIRCNSGMSLIEFALILPVILLLFLGTLEVSRYAILHLKVDKTANAMADFLTQGGAARYADMDNYASNADHIMRPYAFTGTIIYTGVTFRDVGVPPCEGISVSCISWQYKPIGNDASLIGQPGGNANMPGGYVIPEGQIAIVAEVFYHYEPLVAFTGSLVPALAPHPIYKAAVYKPRQVGSMMDPPT